MADQAVIDMSKEFLPKHSDGAFDDSRANIVIADGIEFIQNCQEQFDVIISDSTDPVGLAENLYKDQFYKQVNTLLNPDGVFMCQTESPFYDEYDIKNIYYSSIFLFISSF